MVSRFQFKLTTEGASALTHDLVSKDQIQKCAKDVQSLFTTVCERVSEPEIFKGKVMGFLLQEFEKVKTLASV
jgi:hypothetical protein